MKFTNEDLMKAMKLQVGDRISINNELYTIDEFGMLHNDIKSGYYHEGYISEVICNEDEYEILPKPKRIGDLKCNDFECIACPLKYICCLTDWGFSLSNRLYNILELFNCDDQEIYDLLKSRLDKVVE